MNIDLIRAVLTTAADHQPLTWTDVALVAVILGFVALLVRMITKK